MKKNKKIFALLTTVSLTLVLSIITLGVHKESKKFMLNGYASDNVDCERYFNQEYGYTGLYEIIENLNSGVGNIGYKTWGTVTKAFLGSNDTKNFYIQSSDKHGRIAGVLVYNSSLELSEGNVITITGTPILYDNIPEFLNPSISDITFDYSINNSPVQTLVTNSSFWQNSADSFSSEFLNAQSMGARKVALNDVYLEYVSNSRARAYFNDGIIVSLYFASVKNTSAISSYLQSIDTQQVNITGILHSRIDSSGNAQMQVLIRDVSDVTLFGGGTSENKLTLNSTNTTIPGTYATGNYGSTYLSGYEFEYYRTIRSSFVDILPNFANNTSTAPGAFFNTEPIKGMSNISITYYTSTTSGALPLLEYGVNSLNNNVSLPLTTYSNTVEYLVNDANYFKLSTSASILTIEEIVIDYTGNSSSSAAFNYGASGSGEYRINPLTYNGSLTEGVSFSVPASISRNGSKYIVNSYKTYTYYSTAYVESNPALVEAASHIDPIDVATYYTIFKTAPANYVNSAYYSSAYQTFGQNTRCVSFYTRTDGYATAIPWQGDANTFDEYGNPVPTYYELDIALTPAYSATNRGVGRVVAWENGFDPLKGAVNYDASPVCVYTDDHYFTFQEYLNHGAFGKRFNAEGHYTSYNWGLSTTLVP